MHIECQKGQHVYHIDLEESEQGDLTIGSKRFSITIRGNDPELDKVSLVVRETLSLSDESLSSVLEDLSSHFERITVYSEMPQRMNAVRDRVLAQMEESKYIHPEPFKGTCAELIEQIEETVHRTLDTMDYDGLQPYMKLLTELDKGKALSEIVLSSEGETRGTTCVGSSFAILRNLYAEHHITGMFAGGLDLGHGVAIVECQDGFVLIDNRSNENNRLFAVPFGTTRKFSFLEETSKGEVITVDFSLTAGEPGSAIPLIQTYNDNIPHELYVNPALADLVLKNYVSHNVFDFIPIAVYRKGGRPIKDIKISPRDRAVILKDHITGEKSIIPFDKIAQGGLSIEALKKFMGAWVFHSKAEEVHEEILRVTSQIARIQSVFSEAFL